LLKPPTFQQGCHIFREREKMNQIIAKYTIK
jgi:hypothetical protein